jgi:hypothetical protein
MNSSLFFNHWAVLRRPGKKFGKVIEPRICTRNVFPQMRSTILKWHISARHYRFVGGQNGRGLGCSATGSSRPARHHPRPGRPPRRHRSRHYRIPLDQPDDCPICDPRRRRAAQASRIAKVLISTAVLIGIGVAIFLRAERKRGRATSLAS